MTATLQTGRRLLSIGMVAEMVGCAPQTLRNMESRGEIPPASRIEGLGRRFYSMDEVEQIRLVRRPREAAGEALPTT